MKTKGASIQRKLIRLIMAICGLVLFVACASFFIYEFLTFRNIAKRELITLGEVSAQNLTSSLAFQNKDDAAELLHALKAQKNIVAAAVYDQQGNLFATYPDPLDSKLLPAHMQEKGYAFAGKFIEGFQPVVENNRRLGTLFLKSDLKPVYNRFQFYGVIALLFFLLVYLFTYLLSKQLQRSVTNPILHLAGKAKLISEKKDYSVRADKKSNDELGILTDAFNQMLTQIESQNREIQALNSNLEEKIDRRTQELQQANVTLTRQNEFIQTIIDATVDVIAVFDRNLNILILNRYAADFLQRKREDLIGRNILQVLPELSGSPFIANLQSALKGEFIHVESYRSQLADAFFENFYIPLQDRDQGVDRVLLVAHDITGIMKAQEKLQQLNRELEKSNQDLEQFAYVASHDLQEPLRKITTFADLSEQHLSNPEIQKRYLGKITTSARRMTELIKAVLNYSRLSRIENEFSEVDLDMVVEQIKTDLELSIEEKNAVVEKEGLPAIKGVPLQINQLFLNLFTNALKFTETTPHIRISVSPFSNGDRLNVPGLKKEVRYYKIVFSDNGIGFDQKYADRIFAIFQRLHSTEEYAGTGIGLALCKKIVDNHNGAITVHSEKGRGTAFTIYFPIEEELEETGRNTMKRSIPVTEASPIR